MSQFNVENVTTFAEEPDTDTERVVYVISLAGKPYYVLMFAAG